MLNTALGIAIMSYDGRLFFGLLGDYDALPDLDAVAADLDVAIDELARAAGVPQARPPAAEQARRRPGVRRSRQALIALAVAGVASAACLVLIIILASRDPSDVGSPRRPGRARSSPTAARAAPRPGRAADAGLCPRPTRRPAARTTRAPVTRDAIALSDDQLLEALHLGNVVIAYDSARPPAALRTLQRDVAGAFSADLAAAGQAVILDRRPGAGGVIALAWRRELRTSDPADPRLREFADA